MSLRTLRCIIEQAVVAFCEDGDAVDMSVVERARERVPIEILAHIGHRRSDVKIEVDSPERKLGSPLVVLLVGLRHAIYPFLVSRLTPSKGRER